jgi:uncharacterized protein (TIGR00288 family)
MQLSIPQVALLIDADNSPAQCIHSVISKLEEYGAVNVRKAYGNWEKSNLNAWKQRLLKYAIRPVQQYDYTKGKNATDVALTIDAMDLSYTDDIKVFAIVSSDCDFTPLVMRLRERGLIVYGFGESKTPKAFVRACSGFFCLSPKSTPAKQEAERSMAQIAPDTAPDTADTVPGSTPDRAKSSIQSNVSPPLNQASTPDTKPPKSEQTSTKLVALNSSNISPISGAKLKQDTLLITTLRQVIAKHQDKNGWSPLPLIGSQAKIQPKQYGYSKLSSLLKAIDLFEVKQQNKNLIVRCKSFKSQA